ncbi:hypothetical protein [Streptomyces sp. 2132.2]|uniref:hypothetical protein n=1 Tax=Streptomyces sp. 2132.2 TaxID=2485161 RepID=UPI0011CEBDBF|nr:hypothetical protein [Streptomyces sp. 2132.2]
MSTRRTLGTGPTDPTTSTPTAPRLLPAERTEHEHHAVPVDPPAAESAPRSWRTLGQGTDRHRR